jgi:lipopolysaccharide export system permease protein
MGLLDRYLIRAILGSVALVMAVLLVLGGLFLFIGQQDDIGVGGYSASQAFLFVLFNLPQQAWELLPIAALIGSLLGLGALARGSEITVMRATGASPWRLALAASVAAFLLIFLEILMGEFLAAPLEQMARQQKAFSKFSDVSFGGGGGAWVRDGDLILNVARQSGESQFGGMQVFELSRDHRLRAIGHAERATPGPNRAWLLRDYAESRFTSDGSVVARKSLERPLDSTVSAEFLGMAVSDPGQLELATLWRLIGYYEANGLDTRPYEFALWSRIARTVAILFAVLLAIPFVMGSLRSTGSGARTLVGLLLGIAFFLMQRLIESGTFAFGLNPVLLAWLPTALLAALSMGLLIRAR